MISLPAISKNGVAMLIHDDIFTWKGFGGVYQLAAGRCRLRIFDLSRGDHRNVTLLKPIVVVVSDLPHTGSGLRSVSVRSCTSHIATCVAHQFNIAPQRMTYVEYYPASHYGVNNEHVIPAKFDAVEFTWFDDKAMHPKWRPLPSPMLETVVELIEQSEAASVQR